MPHEGTGGSGGATTRKPAGFRPRPVFLRHTRRVAVAPLQVVPPGRERCLRRDRHDGRRAATYHTIYCLLTTRRHWRLGILHRVTPVRSPPPARYRTGSAEAQPGRPMFDSFTITRQSTEAGIEPWPGRRDAGFRRQSAEHGEHVTTEALCAEVAALHSSTSSFRAGTYGAGHDRPPVAVRRC